MSEGNLSKKDQRILARKAEQEHKQKRLREERHAHELYMMVRYLRALLASPCYAEIRSTVDMEYLNQAGELLRKVEGHD
jgi:hypothetical protein